MNSLFNYELDERNIRLTLKDSNLQFSEAAWEDFDRNFKVASPKSGLELNLPKIDLNINRSFLVPLFFIIALGGISALLFSFVDFKSNKPVQVEKTLEPNASNYKQEVVVTQPEPKKEVKENKEIVPQVVAENKEAVVQNTVSPEPVQNISQNKTESSSVPATEARKINTPVTPTTEELTTQSTPTVASETRAVNTNSSRPRKKRKRITGEQIETIKVPSLIVGQETSSEEEELKLK
jgi:hypothetical protein